MRTDSMITRTGRPDLKVFSCKSVQGRHHWQRHYGAALMLLPGAHGLHLALPCLASLSASFASGVVTVTLHCSPLEGSPEPTPQISFSLTLHCTPCRPTPQDDGGVPSAYNTLNNTNERNLHVIFMIFAFPMAMSESLLAYKVRAQNPHQGL